MQRRRQDIEFDLRRLFTELWRKLPVIILCAALAAVCVGTAEYFFAEREYRSATKLYVQAKQEEGGILSTDMQMNTLLTKDYAELIKTRDVTAQVITRLGLDMTHEELLSKMTVSVPADTRIIEISVTDTDPKEARRIVQAISSTASVHIREVTDAQAVNTAEKANMPTDPVSPRIPRDSAAGALFGAAVSALAVTVRFLRDDRLYTSEDIEQVLGISTLGFVPLVHEEKKKRRACA